MHPEVSNAFDVALNDLRKCFGKRGILAGRKKLSFYKARNSFFASLGANQVGEFGASWKSIELFLEKQRKDGMIPHRITAKGKAHFHHLISEPLDGNALLVIALKDYVERAKDKEFGEKHFEKAGKALDWLKKHDRDRDLLLEENFFCSWQETVLKSGKVLYSNCLYFKALQDFGKLCRILGRKELAEEHEKLSARVKEMLNCVFWQGNYYFDWIDYMKHDNFSTDGNVLAVLFGLADKEQGIMIENKIKQHQLNKVPLQLNYPVYPFWRIPPGLFPIDAYHYHNGSSWLWLGSLNVIAMNNLGLRKESRQEIRKIASFINRYGSVHEVFLNGKPINSTFLKSEPYYSLSSGLFVKAVKELSAKEK